MAKSRRKQGGKNNASNPWAARVKNSQKVVTGTKKCEVTGADLPIEINPVMACKGHKAKYLGRPRELRTRKERI